MKWFRRMPLRGRLSLLTAAAVAIAVAVAAVACWFVVRDQLYSQARQNLMDVNVTGSLAFYPDYYSFCGTTPADAAAKATAATGGRQQTQPGGPSQYESEWLPASGVVCLPASSSRGIQIPGDYAKVIRPTVFEGTFTDGSAALVKVSRNPDRSFTLIAVPTQSIEQPLQRLAVLLFVVAALGVLVAAAIGLVVARAALRPVHRLTEAVEHIARTEELGTTIPVEGKDEIARLSESFNSMSTALASSRERQSQLIADAGHELRTPLTSLRTNVDLLVRSEETGRALPVETHSRLLRNMKAQMGELSTLIGDLLELSRPARPKGGNPLQVIALHDTVTRALERARLRGPGLKFDVTLEPWYVRADPHTLERAVINLLDNAVKFSPAEGTVEVRLRFGELTVRDHGPGIAVEDLPHVFERFWRSPSARQLPGSGLGLAIVAQTIRDAGGEVSLATVSPGTLATVRLPGAPTPPPELPELASTM